MSIQAYTFMLLIASGPTVSIEKIEGLTLEECTRNKAAVEIKDSPFAASLIKTHAVCLITPKKKG